MPSYNTSDFIVDAIKSVQAQTYTEWELLIVDDCSTDDTDLVVAAFHDQRIRYFRNDKNSGAAISRNRALREAKGLWIAFLDSDDLWLPRKLEKQIDFMEKNNYHFSYTSYRVIDVEGVPLDTVVSGPKRITAVGMFNYCWPGCLTVMYNKQFIGLIQIADIKKNNDYAMWLKICRKADCFFLENVLAEYRSGRKGSISTHSFYKMIKWHYILFREAEKQNRVVAIVNTFRNLVFGLLKKIVYIKHR